MAKWTREDMIVAYALYCITPMNKMTLKNKIIHQVAETFNHSVSSLIMCMKNFIALDPNSDKKGLSNFGKHHMKIFEEFRTDFGTLSSEAEKITGLALFDADPINGASKLSASTNKNQTNRERHFFRASVLATYDNRCCISGLTEPALLVASHIKPFTKCRDKSERTSPTNGLCLNVLYDRAFDQGLMTVTPDYKIHIASKSLLRDEFSNRWFYNLEGQTINLPPRFLPDKKFLEYHNDTIYKR